MVDRERGPKRKIHSRGRECRSRVILTLIHPLCPQKVTDWVVHVILVVHSAVTHFAKSICKRKSTNGRMKLKLSQKSLRPNHKLLMLPSHLASNIDGHTANAHYAVSVHI
eukprot:Lithocolla_globosa_v1_NODE_327_length_4455_cov_172.448409.p4 type:complete len:110 gc:universal NODE_327_length_4455_cov_172.448409:907-1236(+)